MTHKHKNEDILIPESVMLRVFNRATGAQCRTIEETAAYLEEHPEARKILEQGPPKPPPKNPPKARRPKPR